MELQEDGEVVPIPLPKIRFLLKYVQGAAFVLFPVKPINHFPAVLPFSFDLKKAYCIHKCFEMFKGQIPRVGDTWKGKLDPP